MKIRILSDLHIEFLSFEIPAHPDDSETVLVLAGDIGIIAKKDPLHAFLTKAACQFKAVVFVHGNHEIFNSIWPDALHVIKGWDLPENLHILERESVEIDDVIFLGATLWTDFENEDPLSMMKCQSSLNDFKLIGVRFEPGRRTLPHNAGRFTAPISLQDHKTTCQWLAKSMAEFGASGKKMVVVTHHGVAPGSIHSKYAGNPLNGAFVSDLSDLLIAGGPVLVVHGHIHESVNYWLDHPERPIQVIANPRGYAKIVGTQENKSFNPLLTVEI